MSIALDRIRFFLAKLSDERTSKRDRMACWRLISSAALDAHEQEVQQFSEATFVMADPSLTGERVT